MGIINLIFNMFVDDVVTDVSYFVGSGINLNIRSDEGVEPLGGVGLLQCFD